LDGVRLHIIAADEAPITPQLNPWRLCKALLRFGSIPYFLNRSPARASHSPHKNPRMQENAQVNMSGTAWATGAVFYITSRKFEQPAVGAAYSVKHPPNRDVDLDKTHHAPGRAKGMPWCSFHASNTALGPPASVAAAASAALLVGFRC
jgi:hypothetical protein